MSLFLHDEFNKSLCRVQSVLQIAENQVNIIFLPGTQSYGIFKTAKISNLKAHNNEQMAVKEKEPYFNII